MKKFVSIFMIVIILLSVFCVSPVFAGGSGDPVEEKSSSGTGSEIIDGIPVDIPKNDQILEIAGKVVGAIQFASIVATVILVAVFGFQFIMGSADQKSDYQKKFIPLIVGVVVVFFGTTIAKMIFDAIGK